MSPENSRAPGGESQGSDDCHVTDSQNDTRCGRCGLLLSSPRSVRVGYGRTCWPLVRDGQAAA